MTQALKYPKIHLVTSASVEKGTQKNWDTWIEILERAGARAMTHKEIVEFLRKKYRLSLWWQQGVTHGFEIATGRILEGQTGKGDYTVTATRSSKLDASKVWKKIASTEGIAGWLKPLGPMRLKPGQHFETEDGYFGEVRTLAAGKSARLSWQDPEWKKKTYVQVMAHPRPKGGSILVFSHDKIQDAKTQALLRKRWKEALEALLPRSAQD